VSPSDWIALAAVGVSGLAVSFGWLTARTSSVAQSRLAEDERLWERRVDLYLELLNVAKKAHLDRRPIPSGIPDGLTARVEAFASKRVLEAWTLVVFTLDRNARYLLPEEEQRRLDPVDDDDAKWSDSLAKRLHQLHAAIRADLRSDHR
jgi:hypothetical protein